MSTFEITWTIYGTAKVDAEDRNEAIKFASDDLMNWSGFGIDLDNLEVDGGEFDAAEASA